MSPRGNPPALRNRALGPRGVVPRVALAFLLGGSCLLLLRAMQPQNTTALTKTATRPSILEKDQTPGSHMRSALRDVTPFSKKAARRGETGEEQDQTTGAGGETSEASWDGRSADGKRTPEAGAGTQDDGTDTASGSSTAGLTAGGSGTDEATVDHRQTGSGSSFPDTARHKGSPSSNSSSRLKTGVVGSRRARAALVPELGTGEDDKEEPQESEQERQERLRSIPVKEGSVAICLAGGLRSFELTAFTLAQHLFTQYAPADVFLSAPVDENSHKVLLLLNLSGPGQDDFPAGGEDGVDTPPQVFQGWRLKGVRFLAQQPLEDSPKRTSFLRGWDSPNGVQNLLQYFELVEGCIDLIRVAELRQGFQYSWIVRTRPDAFWARPAPPLSSLNPTAYNHPEGSPWGGINDRFGAATQDVALTAMQRLSMVDELARAPPQARSGINSEAALKLHLGLKGISTSPTTLSFCILSFRNYSWPLTPTSIPVFALGSAAPLNGAKCKPCSPAVTGQEARGVVQRLKKDKGLPLRPGARVPAIGYDLCNSTDAWPAGWESTFDAEAGEVAAAWRTRLANMSTQECMRGLRRLAQAVPFFSGPSAGSLCRALHLGPVFDALASKTTSGARRVMHVLAAVDENSSNRVLVKAFPSLSLWNYRWLPLPPRRATRKCKPCQLVVRLWGSRQSMRKKSALARVMRRHGWELLKCGGEHFDQTCLFLRP